MEVYATGRLIYGFVRNENTEDLFAAIVNRASSEEIQDGTLEELHQELQEEHHVSLYTVDYANVDILAACDASASAKSFDSQAIPSEYLTQTTDYDQKIAAFLEGLDVDPTLWKPGWYILGYMS